jgi:hypothetical protein
VKSRLSFITILLLAACDAGVDPKQAEVFAMPSSEHSVISRVAPANLPVSEIVAYLHREFGESPEDPSALDAKDLAFFGSLKFADRTEHIWRFPCSADTGCWLRVTEYSTGSMMAWSVNAPPGA